MVPSLTSHLLSSFPALVHPLRVVPSNSETQASSPAVARFGTMVASPRASKPPQVRWNRVMILGSSHVGCGSYREPGQKHSRPPRGLPRPGTLAKRNGREDGEAGDPAGRLISDSD